MVTAMAYAGDGFIGLGTTLTISGLTSPDIISISGPGLSRDAVDVTSMGSTDGYREFIPGLLDAGELTIEVWFNAAEDPSTLIEGSESSAVITFDDAGDSVWTMPGFCTGFEPNTPLDGGATATVTWKLTGVPTSLAV